MIRQLVQLERLPIGRIQDRQQDLKTQQAKFNDLKNLLNTVRDKAKALDELGEIMTTKVASADETVVKATATGDAALGRYAINITSLATAERTYSDPFASKVATGLFGTGTISIQVGTDDAVEIEVEADDTLETVAAKINSSDAEVTAGVIFTGTQYRLQIAGKETGLANAITFVETGTTLDLANAANQFQAADDAAFTVDGLPMTSTTNTVKDAIRGVTLDLLKDQASTTIEVQRDPAALEAAIKEFVDAYNSVQKKINTESIFTGQARGPESLVGDSTLRSVQSRMRTLAGSPVAGLGERSYSNMFNSATTAGLFGTGTLSIQAGSGGPVNVNVTGADTLTTLATKINQANANVTASVQEIDGSFRLQVLRNGGATGGDISFGETGTSLGLSSASNHHDAEAYTTLASIGISSLNDGTLKIDSTKLQAALADDAEGVARVLIKDGENGTAGLMSSMQDLVKTFTESPNGAITARIKGIDRRMKDYDKQIDAMERRVEDYETRLTAQFTAMERMVSSLQAQGQQMLGMFGG